MPLTYLSLKFDIKPNTITVLSLVSFLFGGYFFIESAYLGTCFFWVLSYVLDCTDGAVARASSRQSDFGAYLDVIIDRFISLIFLFLIVNKASKLDYVLWQEVIIIVGALGIVSNAVISNLRVLYFPSLKGFGKRDGSLLSNPFIRTPYELMDTGNVFFLVSISFYFGFEHVIFFIYSLITAPLLVFNIILAKRSCD